MVMAGLIFVPHPPNFENQYNIGRCSNNVSMILFYFSTSFRFSKISAKYSIHICSCPWINVYNFACIIDNTSDKYLSPIYMLPFFLSHQVAASPGPTLLSICSIMSLLNGSFWCFESNIIYFKSCLVRDHTFITLTCFFLFLTN